MDPLIALHYQLAHIRNHGSLDAIVVADASGVVVAGAGSWAVCEELAAYAPLLARAAEPRESLDGASRVEALRAVTAITSFEVDDQEVLVCVRGGGGEGRTTTAKAAAFGVARILKAVA